MQELDLLPAAIRRTVALLFAATSNWSFSHGLVHMPLDGALTQREITLSVLDLLHRPDPRNKRLEQIVGCGFQCLMLAGVCWTLAGTDLFFFFKEALAKPSETRCKNSSLADLQLFPNSAPQQKHPFSPPSPKRANRPPTNGVDLQSPIDSVALPFKPPLRTPSPKRSVVPLETAPQVPHDLRNVPLKRNETVSAPPKTNQQKKQPLTETTSPETSYPDRLNGYIDKDTHQVTAAAQAADNLLLDIIEEEPDLEKRHRLAKNLLTGQLGFRLFIQQRKQLRLPHELHAINYLTNFFNKLQRLSKKTKKEVVLGILDDLLEASVLV